MVQRCTNPSTKGWESYGGRGITVCERWRGTRQGSRRAGGFEAFLADMGARPAGTTLERIDNARGYEPGNCRWATVAEQNRNSRRNRVLTLNGTSKTIMDWAAQTGIPFATIWSRLRYGWSDADALTRPVQAHRRKAA